MFEIKTSCSQIWSGVNMCLILNVYIPLNGQFTDWIRVLCSQVMRFTIQPKELWNVFCGSVRAFQSLARYPWWCHCDWIWLSNSGFKIYNWTESLVYKLEVCFEGSWTLGAIVNGGYSCFFCMTKKSGNSAFFASLFCQSHKFMDMHFCCIPLPSPHSESKTMWWEGWHRHWKLNHCRIALFGKSNV